MAVVPPSSLLLQKQSQNFCAFLTVKRAYATHSAAPTQRQSGDLCRGRDGHLEAITPSSCPSETCWSSFVRAQQRWPYRALPWTWFPLLSSWLVCQESTGNPRVSYSLLTTISRFQSEIIYRGYQHLAIKEAAGWPALPMPNLSGVNSAKGSFSLVSNNTEIDLQIQWVTFIYLSCSRILCMHVGKSTSEAFKWISALGNACSMNEL